MTIAISHSINSRFKRSTSTYFILITYLSRCRSILLPIHHRITSTIITIILFSGAFTKEYISLPIKLKVNNMIAFPNRTTHKYLFISNVLRPATILTRLEGVNGKQSNKNNGSIPLSSTLLINFNVCGCLLNRLKSRCCP